MTVELLPNERIDDIGRGMKLIQSASTPCFSIDAVLLADFAAGSACRVIDLGTGTGVIPLLLSRRMPQARFKGVELMPPMASQAQRSVELNGLCQRIEVFCGDIRNAAEALGKESADLVIANPPYYKVGHGRPNKNELFAAARQEKFCTLPDVVATAAALLKNHGSLCLIIRAERAGEAAALMTKQGFALKRFRAVQPYAAKPANMVLMEGIKGGRCGTEVLVPPIVYAAEGRYTKEMKEIYER